METTHPKVTQAAAPAPAPATNLDKVPRKSNIKKREDDDNSSVSSVEDERPKHPPARLPKMQKPGVAENRVSFSKTAKGDTVEL